MIPAQFPPPISPGEFISPITVSPKNRIEVGALFIGGGPASLAGSIRLAQLLDRAPEIRSMLGDLPIAIIEKGKYPGAHLLAGAIVNPVSLKMLFPDLDIKDFPFFGPVEKDALYLLTSSRAIPVPVPPMMQNRGNYCASISKLGSWLGKQAEALGVNIFSETPGVKLLVEDGRIRGVRTGDKGRDREGRPLPNFLGGTDIIAKVTILGEGCQGHLTQSALEHFEIIRPNPQIFALGVKELWEVPRPLNKVIHTMGWPLKWGKQFREFGGSFIYPMGPDLVSLGMVVGLDYHDSSLSVHGLLQELKMHPFVSEILKGGQRIENGWGAKTIPEGGFYSLPGRLSLPGALLIGDGAGFLNVPALKGIHYAVSSGMLAADAIFDSLKSGGDPGAMGTLDKYDQAIKESFISEDLYKVRNMRQAFGHGLLPGSILAWLMTLTGGRFPGWRFKTSPDNAQPLFTGMKHYPEPDGKQTFDKLSSVFASGNRSRDNQPVHIRIQTSVPEQLGDAWINMCPANVYEWGKDQGGNKIIKMLSTNCIHCGAINAKGGRLTPTEGGSGPEYEIM